MVLGWGGAGGERGQGRVEWGEGARGGCKSLGENGVYVRGLQVDMDSLEPPQTQPCS
jgi:hypothetical protein